MVMHKVWLFPVASTVLALSSFILCYIIAVANNHVDAFLPYISDTGTFPPESCVFAQFLNLSAAFMAISIYLRHRQIVEYYGHRLKMNGTGRWRRVSGVLLCIGYYSAFGTSMVANFQETNVSTLHDIAALSAFFTGLVYGWGQVLFGYFMIPRMCSLRLSLSRLALCIISTVFLFFHVFTLFAEPFGTSTIEANANATTTTQSSQEIERYKPGEPEYANHLVTTASEWLLVLGFELFILSFAIELRHAYAHTPKLIIKPGQYDMDDSSETVRVSYIAPDGSTNSSQTASDSTLTSR